MSAKTLRKQSCEPCRGGLPPLSRSEAAKLLKQLSGWGFSSGKKAIFKTLRMKDFSAAIDYMRRIAKVANREDHHPDLHLTGYRSLRIDLSTHSIGGLSINDFILAAKIDQLPKKLKV